MDTKKLRQKILDLAIHGKLVPQDSNDEPASVLLERIRAEKERLIKEGKIKKSKASKTSDTPHYENVPFEVPKGWCVVSLSELFMLNPKNEIDDNAEVGFIPMTNVEDGFYGDHTFEVREWKGVKKGYCHFQNGDIGVAKISPCFENLKSCIFHSLPNGFGAGTTELVILRSMGVYSPFYLYLFKSTWYISQGTTYFKGVVGQQRVNKAIFTELEVPLPSYGEQQRIVAEIEKWFALIDIIESGKTDLQTTIKQAKRKILDLAIHGKLVPQDPNDEPAYELLKRINPKAELTCDNGQYGKMPEEWIMCTIGDLFDVVSAKRVLKSDWKNKGIPFYRAREIVQLHKEGIADKDLFITEELFAELKDKFGTPNVGDIMLSAVGSIGYTYIVNEKDSFYYKDASVLCLRNVNKLNSQYFSMLFETTFVKEQMHDNSKGTTVDTITIEKLKKYFVPLPPLAEQHRIVIKIEELFSSLDNIQKALEV